MTVSDIPLSTATSPAARSWNTGLQLGVVSEICHQIRFDPTGNSLCWFNNSFPALRNAFFTTLTTADREAVREQVEALALEVDRTFHTLELAENQLEWHEGSMDNEDLLLTMPQVPRELHPLHKLIDDRTLDGTRPALRAGIDAGQILARAHYVAGGFLVISPSRIDGGIPSSEHIRRLAFQLTETFQTLFEALGWQTQRWEGFLAEVRSAVPQSSNDRDTSDTGWESPIDPWQRAAEAQVELAVLHGALVRVSEEFVREHDLETEAVPSEGGYLGITLHNNRVARRPRYDPVEFMGRRQLWTIFTLLVERGEEYVSLSDLQNCCRSQNRAAVDTSLNNLSEIIANLNLSIENRRNEGWRLEELCPLALDES